MKKLVFYCLLLLGLTHPVTAQITITNSVFPAVGETFHFAFGNQPGAINEIFTAPGGGQQWDLSDLQPTQFWDQVMKNPATGTNSGSFPGASILYNPLNSGSEVYLQVTGTQVLDMGYFGLDELGLGLNLLFDKVPNLEESWAPVNFFDIHQSTSNVLTAFDASIAPPILLNLVPTADSFRIRVTYQRLGVIDAWGTLTIPGGTFDVLRKKQTEYKSQAVDVKVAPLGWIDISTIGGQQILPLGTDTITTFHFLNDVSKEAIAICSLNTAQNEVTGVQYKSINICPTITFTATPTNTCPGSNNGQIVVSGVSGGTGPYMYSKDNGANFQSGATFTGLSAGNYQIVVKDANGCTGGPQSVTVGTFTASSCTIDFSGKIIFSNNNSLGVNNATVSLTGSATGSDVSDTNGDFFIATAVSSGSFILKPSKTINKLNGVTAGDVIAIQQHVANTLPITDLYKQVAADVNKTNSINSTDASIINQALLGNPAALAQIKTSWRFVPTSHTMNNPPWGFPEQRTYTNINSIQTNQDFYGIKTGDVATVFANPANFGAGQSFVLQEKDRLLQAGETFALEFSAGQMDDLAAFQCALRFNPAQLQFVEIQPFAALPLTMDNFGTYNIAEGEIRLVWAQATAVAVSEAAPVFSIQFTALQSGAKLSDVLQLDESELPALAYTSALAESKLELKFSELTGTGNPAGAGGVQLLQNRPNPFNGQTVIGFVLPEACEAQLRVFDVSGRLLAERKGLYPAGRNEEILEVNGATGVLYYELTTPFGVVSKKMVTM